MKQIFISDLHLTPNDTKTADLFFQFLRLCQQTEIDALYILGDFFDVWIGDDDPEPFYHQIFESLSTLSQNGSPVYLMVGNRDFLMNVTVNEHCLSKQYPLIFLPDPHPLTLCGKQAILMHGDSLCTDDQPYQDFRKMTRSTDWQQQLLQKSVAERRAIAKNLSEQSAMHNQTKTVEIMDVNAQAVIKTLQQYNASLLVHGHTHRPCTHALTIDNTPATRIVLGDWHNDSMHYAIADNDAIVLKSYRRGDSI